MRAVMRLAWITLAVAAALALASCGVHRQPPPLVVGSSPDRESALLAHLYAGALSSYGFPVRVETAPDPWRELDSGSYSVVPGLTGEVLQQFQPGAKAVTAPYVYRAMVAALPEGLAAGDYTTAADDTPTAAVTEATARAWGGRELTALVRNCAKVTSGTVAGVAVPTVLGGCTLSAPRQFDSDAALFDALRTGAINAAWITAADPGVPSDVVALADRRPPLVQAENVVPLYRSNELDERQVLAIDEVAGELDTAALTDMRRQVANGADPGQVSGAWLAEHPLGRS
jgi:glycine betaine/choline ABC-type transport system substrate-binding protein